MSEVSQEDLDELKSEVDSLRKEIELQIQGNLDGPGIASRLQSCESELKRHNFGAMKTELVLLKDNKIQDGQTRLKLIEEKLSSLTRIQWTIGSAAMMAIVGALLNMVVGK